MSIAENLTDIRAQIAQLEHANQRPSGAVRLLAVSKTKPVADLEAAYEAGQRCFGENYVQEAVEKHAALAHLTDIEWHFIGPLQSNKAKAVAQTMDWIHSVDREKIALRLSENRPQDMAPLNVLIQVNLSGEASKSGVSLDEIASMAELVNSLPSLTLRGLMAIPAPQVDEASQREVYRPLTQAFLELSQRYDHIDTLSIGMSDDLSAAIASGSTMVRVGTAIFGARNYG
ncbi:YggS family pyridoxal phosphate-dependent enzyme [Maribrevibacterium harenarium]|uniref:Pyridoxal phosphate homeostasis protein n=1 Tax=Maribrevibacterium harenarium TaxID=2589817 RepID=A0A501WKB1_9GAMM|nr:YggS family pyridoxal phosphate-dependent enzyme [Maribrevibacterium harenarium]TPE49788.1 YggS family pyridoxal phosphate-dependent enzyme [Maribrevibacterium harenarium]